MNYNEWYKWKWFTRIILKLIFIIDFIIDLFEMKIILYWERTNIQAKIFYFLIIWSFLSSTPKNSRFLVTFSTILNKTPRGNTLRQIYSGIGCSEFPTGMQFLIPHAQLKFLSPHRIARRLTISHDRLKINPCRFSMIHPWS